MGGSTSKPAEQGRALFAAGDYLAARPHLEGGRGESERLHAATFTDKAALQTGLVCLALYGLVILAGFLTQP